MELLIVVIALIGAILGALTAWFNFSDVIEVNFNAKLEDGKLKLILKKTQKMVHHMVHQAVV